MAQGTHPMERKGDISGEEQELLEDKDVKSQDQRRMIQSTSHYDIFQSKGTRI